MTSAETMTESEKAALRVMQQAVKLLQTWSGANLDLPENEAIATDKNLVGWDNKASIQPLQLIFDSVKLSEPPHQRKTHYLIPQAIADEDPCIPFPVSERPDSEFIEYKQFVKEELKLTETDWNNLALLTAIVEKYGSFISLGESNIALIDLARSTAAVAAALTATPEPEKLCLVAGDLSGIQKFIYTISSEGALKSLRARSFYLELVTEEVVQQLLTELQLPRTNVIYAGGGNLYILAKAGQKTNEVIKKISQELNKWLFNEFQGKVFLALACHDFDKKDVSSNEFSKRWQEVAQKLNQEKSQKFKTQIQIQKILDPQEAYTPCKVCHRDDVKPEKLKLLNREELNSVLACETCHRMFELGGQLFKVNTVLRSQQEQLSNSRNKIESIQLYKTSYYLLDINSRLNQRQNNEQIYLINNWKLTDYKQNNVIPLLLGNYGQKMPNEDQFIRAFKMAEEAKGVKRVGYLRMDVDRLGQIFSQGLGEQKNLPRLAGLSRQMSYFFKVYLNSLAKNRQDTFINKCKKFDILKNTKYLDETDERKNLLFIYAGGDDLFISGSWNEIVEFAFDIYQCFRAYTGYNRDITISGGIAIAGIKYPLYLAAKESGKAEEAAKDNGRDSLGLFGEAFKWEEWLGHLESDELVIGVLPLVKKLQQQIIDVNVSRNFVRNLLLTAQIQDQMIDERNRKIKYLNKNIDNKQDNKQIIVRLEQEKKDIRSYLHLPKIAYTLARLPNHIREQEQFKPIRKSLLNCSNAPYFRAVATWIELLNRS